ncbi:MAG: cytochrome c3 family protein [Bacteroidota bacterium]
MRNLFILFLLIGPQVIMYSQSIVTTKHNLSVRGPGELKASSETEICLFCHTPHSSRPLTPLWNRNDPGVIYTLYTSSTMKALPGQPDGTSMLCLSCHDGTIALGNVTSRSTDRGFQAGVTNMPQGLSNLNTNLRNDHPISFLYTASLAMADGQLKPPSGIIPPVSLENGKVQCTSCHDPHKNMTSDFLVTTTQNSNLCNSCHQRTYWMSSSHSTSTKTWNGTPPDPWPYTEASYTTVAQNACESCHNPHNSGSDVMLLMYQKEENNCLDCHNGNVASKNIAADFNKSYKHNIGGYMNIHVPNEPVQLYTSMHVECVDCHNPHAAKNQAASPPAISGALAGVKGITQTGTAVNPASYEYEICYRCHAGSAGSPPAATSRILVQNSALLEFAPANPSFHPVAAMGKNPMVPSLITPWTTSSIMYCTSCHSGDGSSSSEGPHGSIYPHILKLQNLTTDGGTTASGTTESASAYALCYSCHNRASILSDVSFKGHNKHLQSLVRAPCNTCHDPHGISITQGTLSNNSNLINFKAGVVTPSANGQLKFVDLPGNHSQCYLTCHGKNHDPLNY